jgi:hypothetical protein
MNFSLRVALFLAIGLSLGACGTKQSGVSMGGAQGVETGGSEPTCGRYEQAIQKLNAQVQEYQKGVFYAYYCR